MICSRSLLVATRQEKQWISSKRLTTEISTRLSPMVAVVPITAVWFPIWRQCGTFLAISSVRRKHLNRLITARWCSCSVRRSQPYLWMRSAEQLMKSWLNLESVVESRTLSPVVVMAISEHRPMLTAITRYVHTKKRTNSTSITSSSHQGQALHRRVLCAVRLCMETREKSWVSALPERIQEVGRWCLTAWKNICVVM